MFAMGTPDRLPVFPHFCRRTLCCGEASGMVVESRGILIVAPPVCARNEQILAGLSGKRRSSRKGDHPTPWATPWASGCIPDLVFPDSSWFVGSGNGLCSGQSLSEVALRACQPVGRSGPDSHLHARYLDVDRLAEVSEAVRSSVGAPAARATFVL